MDPLTQQQEAQQSVFPHTPSQQMLEENHIQEKRGMSLMRSLVVIGGIVILGGLLWGAYILGTKQTHQNFPASVAQSSSPTPIPSGPTAIPPSTAPVTQLQTVTAGGYSTLKKYSLQVPGDWNATRTTQSNGNNVNGEKMQLSKENHADYIVTILQGGGDGGTCSYPDNKITTGIVHGDYEAFSQFKDQDANLYRRGSDGENAEKTGITYTICQLQQDTYTNSTSYGWIFYTVPKNPDEQLLKEMDSIVASLKAR